MSDSLKLRFFLFYAAQSVSETRHSAFLCCISKMKAKMPALYFSLPDESTPGLALDMSLDISKVGPFHVGTAP